MKKFNIKKCFLIFMIYSIVGWILEALLAIVCLHKFVNRGFLLGPYLPIYGAGAILMILLLDRYKDKPALLVLFSMLICSTLEYFTSFILEIAFNTRWWDYSNGFINLHGRICLETTVLFGLLGALIIYVVNPFFAKVLDRLPVQITNILFYVLLVIILLDTAVSLTSIISIRNTFDGVLKDTTEEVSKKAFNFLKGIIVNIKKALV